MATATATRQENSTTEMPTFSTTTAATTTTKIPLNGAAVATNPTKPTAKRGHKRSVSLETNAAFMRLRSPTSANGLAGSNNNSLKKKLSLKPQFANYKCSSLNDPEEENFTLPLQGRTKFQNIRQMFEISRNGCVSSGCGAGQSKIEAKETTMQSLPSGMSMSLTTARKVTPTNTLNRNGSGSVSNFKHRLNMENDVQQHKQQQQQQQQQRHPQSLQEPSSSHGDANAKLNNNNINNEQSTDGGAAAASSVPSNFLRPIAFKPIPFEPDYCISNPHYQHPPAYQMYCEAPNSIGITGVPDRYGYGSTPSLAATQPSKLKFGSTTDLRHGGGGIGGAGVAGVVSHSLYGVGVGNVGILPTYTMIKSPSSSKNSIGNSNNNNHNNNNNNNCCNSLTTATATTTTTSTTTTSRRYNFRTLASNDSMESVRHTPELLLDADGRGSKSNYNTSQHNAQSTSKGMLNNAQYELTPSPSDSGISELEAALKDRDSELSYLRQAMEHNEKDKETNRLKHFYEAQQREYLLKFKKMEQMLALQHFQLKQHKLRHGESAQKLLDQVTELKHELELSRTSNAGLKNSENNQKETIAFLNKQLGEAHAGLAKLRVQLEDSEWKVCERNGEIALLKTQLKEANLEITVKDHALVNLRNAHNNSSSSSNLQAVEFQKYQSQQHQPRQQQQQHPSANLAEGTWQLVATPAHSCNEFLGFSSAKLLQQQQAAQDNELSQQQQQRKSVYALSDELQQLQHIIMLKDQVIVALTNELSKLRKELSDLAIAHEYGEEPCGRYTRLKQQLDNLNEICQKTQKYTTAATSKKSPPALTLCCQSASITAPTSEGNKIQLDAILQRLKIEDAHEGRKDEKNVTKSLTQMESNTLDTLIEESTTYVEDIAKLRQKLDDFRINLELEKRQWSAEKEKVLNYQKQLQAHYIHMYQKLRCLDATDRGCSS